MTVGFIGTGNMGAALARAAAKSGDAKILLANRTLEKARSLAGELGAETATNSQAAGADYLFVGVKPQQLASLFEEIRPALGKETVIVSMAAGTSLETLGKLSGGQNPVVRILPNLPVSVGKGLTLLCADGNMTPQRKADVRRLLAETGIVLETDEKQLEVLGVVAGCGPAWAAMLTEALADGAVACGAPRVQAIEAAAQMLLGTAALLLETGEHPASLKDRVCSPGGSTICGVRALEKAGFRSACAEAVIAACEKKF